MTKTPQLTVPGSARGRGKLAKSIIERDYPSDTDRTRSASPSTSVYNTTKKSTPNMRINTLLNDDGSASSPAPKSMGRGNWTRTRPAGSGPRNFRSRFEAGTSQDGQSPSASGPTFTGPHGFYLPLNGSDPSHKRTRPLTQHQLAVEQYRRRRVDVILDRGIRIEYKAAARRRRTANTLMRSWVRCKGMPDGYDTDEESNALPFSIGEMDIGTKTPPPMPAGLVPLDFGGEVNDHGEESYYKAKMLSRALRRLERWENGRVTVRVKPKGEVYENDGVGSRPIAEDSEDEGDEDMLDVEEEGLRREEEDESSSSEDDGGELDRERYDAQTLPPLPRMV
jgi:Ino eighty subunit 1